MLANSPFSFREFLTNGQFFTGREMTSTYNGVNVIRTTYEQSEMMPTSKLGLPEDIEEEEEEEEEEEQQQEPVREEKEEEEEDENENTKTVQFVPPQYISTPPGPSPVQSPTVPMSMQKVIK